MQGLALVHRRGGRPDPTDVGRMLDAAPHRGSTRAIAVLGFTAIGITVDPDGGAASMARTPGRLGALCGRLDNRDELVSALDGVAREGSDADVMLASIDVWGIERAVERFRGVFCGVVSDGRTVSVFRDHFGWRPLFERTEPDRYFAATEVKQIVAGARLARRPDMEHLRRVLVGGVELSTAIAGVTRVPRAHVVSVGPHVAQRVRYWDPERLVETDRLGPAEALEGVRDHLDRAVARMLTGRDVLLLSGGLDSTAIAASVARVPVSTRGRPVQALTGTYPAHASVDETAWTRLAADHVGLPLHTFVPSAGSLDDVESWVRRLDGPVSMVSVPEAAQAYAAARELGARTVLNGEIAEYLFESRRFLLDHLVGHGRLGAAVRELRARRHTGTSLSALARQLGAALLPAAALHSYGRWHSAHRGASWLPAWLSVDDLLDAGRGARPMLRLPRRERWVRFQVAAFAGCGSGLEADEISASLMGVESRRPFADVDLWEFVLSLPAEVTYPTAATKPLLREAMRGRLPDPLIDRRDKTYFDEFHLDHADYPKLEELLSGSDHRIDGVDYDVLRVRLASGDMGITELQWARDLARIHAFLAAGEPAMAGADVS